MNEIETHVWQIVEEKTKFTPDEYTELITVAKCKECDLEIPIVINDIYFQHIINETLSRMENAIEYGYEIPSEELLEKNCPLYD